MTELAEALDTDELNRDYTLPDNTQIIVTGALRMRVPELLFRPELNNMQCPSIQQNTWASISYSDVDIRSDLMKNVVLAGGSTMYEGIAERLLAELNQLAP